MRTIVFFLLALAMSVGLMAQPITVTQPNGGELMYGCQTYTIKWTSSGVSNYYDIDYALDGGTIWTSVASNLYITNNQYSWTVPMASSSTVRVRVKDHQSPAKRDSSDNVFTIQLPINVTSPNGGEIWQGLTSHVISWVPGGTSGYFDIYYSIDNGTTWTSVVTNVNSNNYTWNVPNNPSTTCLVKVQDHSTSCQVDLSNAVFTITPANPLLTAPNGGEQWTINSNRTITWDPTTITTGSLVKLEWSVDNGVNYNLITNSAPNTGSYTWAIPNTPSAQCFVRISNASGYAVNDLSNAAFTIKWPGNFLTYPNGGETFRSQNTYNILWDATVFISNVKIEYSINNGAAWNTIIASTSNTGSYSWTVPLMVTTTQALVRITNITWPANIIDTSNAVFTIQAPVTVDYPNTGQTLTACSTVNILWSRTTSFGNYSGYDSPNSYRNTYELYYKVNSGGYSLITTIYNTQAQYSYSYTWTVPDVAGSTVKIEIISKRDTYYDGGAVYWIDSSDVASPVVPPSGSITVLTPNGGVNLTALTNYNITWSASGTSGFYDVLYSTDGGTTYNNIVTNTTGTSYSWNVVNSPGTNVFIRVRDNQNTCRKDASDAANTITVATPLLTYPNGGETWNVNQTYTITWNSSSIISGGNVYLEYSADGGTTWNNITNSTSNTGSYGWTVPNIPTTHALVRISNVGYPSNYDVSDAQFTIQTPTDFLTYPNGGELLRSQNTYNILWNNTLFISNVKLEYSLNSGSTWTTIIASTSNTGSYSWTTPMIVTTTTCLVRITNTTVGTIQDVSNATFTIQAPVTVDYPNTGQTLTACSTVNILWSRTTSFGNYSGYDSPNSYRNTYELYYKVNSGGYSLITTIYNTQAQYSYSYTWTVPDVAGSTVKIEIISKRDTYYDGGAVYWIDSSDVASPVVPPSGSITVLTPNGGVNLTALTNYNITWSASGTSGFYDILYSTDGGTTYNNIVTNTTGTAYSWNVVNSPGTNVFIRVRDNQNTCRKDASDAANTITVATPLLTYPNGGETWNVNQTYTITWNSSTIISGGNVYLEYSADGGTTWNNITNSTSNTGSYGWTVPNIPTTHALVRISNVGYPSNYDVSDAQFTIQTPTDFLTYPNGGELLRSQNTYNILWNNTLFISSVKLEYSLNSGSTWTTIIASTSNTGSYSWTTPMIVTTTTCLVRITNTTVGTIQDVSNATFTIQAPVTVDWPNGQTMTSCSQVNIQWSRTTSFGNYSGYDSPNSYRNTYELYYKVNSGGYSLITTIYNTQAQYSYSYTWTVPDVAGSTVKIEIISKRDTYYDGGAVYWIDSSDVASLVVPPSGSITVLTPNGGVNLTALTNYNITWSASGTSGFYDVLYSTDGGTTYNNIVTNTTGTSYSWNVVNSPGTNVFIRVRDNQNTCRKDASDAANTITVATPLLTYPNGGETWNVNQTYTITWNSSTIISGGNVYLEYSADGGTTWNNITNSTSNTGSYGWTVPNIPTTHALVRISNVGYPSNYDVSDAQFTIQTPTDFLTYPNGGELLRSQNTYNILWNNTLFISNVKLEYSLNSGSTWTTIIASTSNTGSYSWTTPMIVTTTTCLVRITNTTVGTIQDVSNATFTIQAPVTVDYPNTGQTLTACSTVNILWSRTTSFGNYSGYDSPNSYRNTYELYYKVNSGAYSLITTIYNTQAQYSYSYTWTVPDVAGSTVKIEIISKRDTYYDGGVVYWIDSSDVASPVISPSGSITVLTPNGGVNLTALTNYNITWSASGTSGFYDVLYSTDGGTTYNNIVTNTTGTSYSWNVVNSPGTNVFIRVRDNQNTCRKDASDAANTITVATPLLTYPNGGETWNVNQTYTITWNSSTIISGGNVYLEYSADGGTTWNNITNSTSNTGSYGWTVPNIPTTHALVRISNVGYPSNYDVSDAQFTIQTPTDFLTYPNGGELLRSQNTYNILWNNTLFISNVKLEYSLNSGSTWTTIIASTSNTGSYSWTTPMIVTTTTCLVRITNTTVGTIQDVSNATFTIQAPVTVDWPNGQTMTSCSQVNIQWSRTTSFGNYSGYDSPNSYRNTYELYYKVNSGGYSLITTIYNTQAQYSYSYTWTVPDIAGSTVKIEIISKRDTYYDGGAVYWIDSSDVASPVVPPSGSITVLTPNGGVNLTALTNYNITWSASGTSGFYDILYSVDGGVTYNAIASNVTGTTYAWNVTNNPSTNVYIRVRDNQNTCRKDGSDASNTIIAATPLLTAPNGGETWNVNSVQNITWNSNSIPLGTNVFIEYSLDGGATYNTVVASTSNSGTYAWTLPYAPTTQAKVRISVVGNPLLFDMSDAVFTILVPTPVITSPNGGETWYAGESHNITWLQATYFSTTVNIDYSLNGGISWVNIATNVANNGTYAWILPSLNSANALVKVSNYTNTSVYDVSNALLTLRPWVRVITPNGGDQLGSCTQTTISFERAPTYTSFNIDYSTDNGSTWTAIQSNTTYTNTFNNYSWTIPNTPSSQALVRVYPYSNVGLADQSDAVFTIKKAVTVLQPSYGGVLVVGSVYTVKWLSDGISNVYDIAYSTAGPTGPWNNIILGYVTSLNTYSWTVPNTPSTNCYLRITDHVNACKLDISKLAFTIAATPNPITVTAPNGGDTLSACNSYNITWTETGSPIGNYNIAYSIDYGTNWVPVATNYLTITGTYNWVIPNVNSPSTLIRVQSGLNPLVFDYSDALFVIKPGKLKTNNDTTVCQGSSVQLHTTGGVNYLWTPSTGLSNPNIPNPIATPSNTTQYIVTSTSSGCSLKDTVLITVNTNTGLNAAVTISPSTSTAICTGTLVIFTATPTNGGTTPTYQWKINGTNVGTNTYTYTSSSLTDGSVVTCVMTSNLQCVNSNPATSNAITMSVYPMVTPSVSISTPLTTICSGASVVYTATPVNGGVSPVYQWKKNGGNVGTNANTYTDNALNNNDVISVQMTSNANCLTTPTVTSNSILMTVNPNGTPSVSISTPLTSVCSGVNVTFTANALNSGTSPAYQWKVNGVNAGTNSNIFTTNSLANNSIVTCVVTSNAPCNTVNPVTSNAITMTVTASPAAPVATSNSPVPLNGTLNLFASTISGATYSWTGPNGYTSNLQNPAIANATPALNGTYYVTAIVSGCSSPAGSTVVVVNPSQGTVTVSGYVRSEIGQGVNGAKVKLTGASTDSTTTPVNGSYQFSVTQGNNYVITPTKNNDIIGYNGITTLDIVMMQRHILNVQLLSSPYKIIAADVNSSGTVTTLDIVLTKSLILQNITAFPGNKLWAFVNSDFVFANPGNPFPFEASRSYSNISGAVDQNFVAVKLGDVNNSWDPSIAKSLSPVTVEFEAGSANGANGDLITLPVRVNNFNKISGFQYTISWNPAVLDFVTVSNAALDMDYGTLQTANGSLTALYATELLNGITLPDGSAIFNIQFRIVGHNGDVSPVSFNSAITVQEACNNNLDILTMVTNNGLVKVSDATGIVDHNTAGYELLQNIPNPFSSNTDIIFTLPAASNATIIIFDIFGKKVAEIKGDYQAGRNTVIWDGRDTDGQKLSDGTYYYRLQTGNYSAIRKMVLIK